MLTSALLGTKPPRSIPATVGALRNVLEGLEARQARGRALGFRCPGVVELHAARVRAKRSKPTPPTVDERRAARGARRAVDALRCASGRFRDSLHLEPFNALGEDLVREPFPRRPVTEQLERFEIEIHSLAL